MVDSDTFFRTCSQPLHEYLDLQMAAPKCVEAINRFVPADGISIQLLEPSLKSTRSVVWYYPSFYGEPTKLQDSIITMSEKTHAQLKASRLPDLRIVNRPEDDPIGRHFLKIVGDQFSNMGMFLYRNNKRFGLVILSVSGRDRYTESDLFLFSLLHGPFTLALDNYRKSLELVKARQMLKEQSEQDDKVITVSDIVGHNIGLRYVMNLVELVAPQDCPVLINGETGVGKEMVAAAVHSMSGRRNGPLVSVNCGAIPESVVDSELFGHEKGAFTGASSQRKGRFERANHGTIFLDEIGDLKPEIQVKLLRVIQNGEIERVGGTEQIQVDVRVIAATHRNLENMVNEGKFREDLLFRINVFPIDIPPLRARKLDIPALVDHFVHKKSKELKVHPVPSLGNRAIDSLMKYHWPGNVRELKNVIERELILYTGGPLTFDNFEMTGLSRVSGLDQSPDEKLIPLKEAERLYIQLALKQCNGQIGGAGGAAEVLDLHVNTLRNKMLRLGIPFKGPKNASSSKGRSPRTKSKGKMASFSR